MNTVWQFINRITSPCSFTLVYINKRMGGIILDDLKNGALYIGTIPSSMDNNRCSVTLEDDGSVTFYIYAPNANKVEVAGMGGYFSSERIQLKPDMRVDFRQTLKISIGQCIIISGM